MPYVVEHKGLISVIVFFLYLVNPYIIVVWRTHVEDALFLSILKLQQLTASQQ